MDIAELATKFDANHTEVKGLLSASGEKLGAVEKRVAIAEEIMFQIEQKMARRAGPDSSYAWQTPGAIFTASEKFKAFNSNERGKVSVEVKNILTSEVGSAGGFVAPDLRPGVTPLPQRRLTVRDLVSGGKTTSNMVQFVRQNVRTIRAAMVSEGVLKPESDFGFDLVDSPVRTLAHWTKASRQILDDASQLQSVIDGELKYGLSLAEETELLYGDGTGQHLHGIVPQATSFVSPIADPSHLNAFDVLLQAIAQSEAALLPATGIVLNNLDLSAMRALKNDLGDYLEGGGPMSNSPPTIWDRPVVGTPAMVQGTFLVGAFKDGAQIFDRWDAMVMVSTENDTDFVKNLCTVLCEARLAFAVRRPTAFIFGNLPVTT